jgi:hypothetical protein
MVAEIAERDERRTESNDVDVTEEPVADQHERLDLGSA